jgi:hypothetical protein
VNTDSAIERQGLAISWAHVKGAKNVPSKNNWTVGNLLGSRCDLCFVRDIASRPGLVLTTSNKSPRFDKLSCPSRLVSIFVCEDRAEIISLRISLIRSTSWDIARPLFGNRITNGGGDAEDIGGHHLMVLKAVSRLEGRCRLEVAMHGGAREIRDRQTLARVTMQMLMTTDC